MIIDISKYNLEIIEALHRKDELIGEHYKKDKAVEVLGRAIVDKYREFGFRLGDTTYINVNNNGLMPIISRPIKPYETIVELKKDGLIKIKNIISTYDFDFDESGKIEPIILLPNDTEIILKIEATKKLFNKFPVDQQTTENKQKSLFKLPKGAKWEDIEIKFRNKYDIEILVQKKSYGMFSNNNLGFCKTKTKDKRPDKQWEFLQKLSGCISNQSEATTKHFSEALNTSKDNCFKIKQNLSKKLQKIFGISDEPFYNYKDRKFYLPRFALKPEALLRGDGEVWKLASGFDEEIGASQDEEDTSDYLDKYLN